MSFNRWNRYSEMRLLRTPLHSITSCFLALKAVAPVWDRGPRRRKRQAPRNGIKRLSVHTQNLSERLGQHNRHKPTSFRAQRQVSVSVDCLDDPNLLCKARE